MIEIIKIVRAVAKDGFRVEVVFSSGEHGVADFAWLNEAKGALLDPLRDEMFFKRVFVSNGVLAWPNGFEVDAIRLHGEMRDAGLLAREAA
jgi:hypothetical protein